MPECSVCRKPAYITVITGEQKLRACSLVHLSVNITEIFTGPEPEPVRV